jgi:uncharacterized repeat protein (TIGR01451 family)
MTTRLGKALHAKGRQLKPLLGMRRLGRLLAALLTIGLVAVGAPGLTGSAAYAVGTKTTAPNPDLAAGCGLDVVLVLDKSTSIAQTNGAETSVKNAASTFVSAFKNTNTRIGIVEFGTGATTKVPLTYVTTATSANGGTHAAAIASYDAPSGQNGQGVEYTNWAAAATKANEVFTLDRQVPRLLVFVTDGAPTVAPGVSFNNSQEPRDATLDPAILEMNAIKSGAKGVHVLGVGVGAAFGSGNASRVESLQKITHYPNGQYYTGAAGQTFSATTTDLILQQNFSALENDLRMVATNICDGTLTITKEISDQNNPNSYTKAGAGWEFQTAVSPGGDWVKPTAGTGTTRTTSTEASSSALFQWTGTAGWSKTATVTETAKQDYTLQSVTCSTNGGAAVARTITNGAFTVDVGAGKQVECTVRNKFTGNGTTDVGVTKSVSSPTVVVGDEVTWTVTATNNGPKNTANQVVITDTLPAGLTVVPGSSSANAGTFNEGTGVWTIPSLAKDVTRTLTFRTKVTAAGAHKNVVTRTSMTENDTNPANDKAEATVTGIKANLKITKDADVDKQVIGGQVVWTVVVTNDGAATAKDVVVEDTLPAGLAYASHTVSKGSFVSGTGVWTVGDLASGAVATLTLRTTGTTLGEKVNTVETETTTPETKYDDNTASDSVVITVADLVVEKSANAESVGFGDTVVWTIKVTNIGTAHASAVKVQDLLPAGLTFVSASPPGEYDSATGVWTVGTLAAGGDSKTLTLTTKATAIGEVTNEACASSDAVELDLTNNCAEDDVEVLPTDVTISKSADVQKVLINGTVVWTVKVTNTGPANATDVVVTDTLPAGLTVTGHAASTGSFDPGTNVWTVGTLAKNGGTATLLLTTKVPGTTGSLTNLVEVLTGTPETDYTNNEDDDTVDVVAADVKVTKDASAHAVVLGDQVTWTLVATNSGSAEAHDVVVTDTLPEGLELVSTVPAGALVGGSWNVGTLAANGGSKTLTITTRTTKTGSIENTACVVTSTPEVDQTPSCDDDEIVVGAPDLSIVKTVDHSQVGVGDEVEWTLTVSNSGDADAHDVVVTDALPEGLQLVSTIPADALDANTWTVGTVKQDESAVLKIRTKVTQPGTTENTACITGSSVTEPDTEDHCDDETVEAAKTDVSISKTADVEQVLINGSIVWTVVVTNDSQAVAENVKVTDTLPAGLVLDEVEAPAGTSYDDTTNVWTVGTLAKGASKSLTLRTTAPGTVGELVNKVVVTTTTPETDDENNEAEDDVLVVAADVKVTKDAGAESVVLGDTVTWTVVATNTGTADAHDVVVTDVLPEGLELVSTVPADALVEGEWNVGTLAAKGGSKTLTITTRTTKTGSIENTACVVTSTPETDTTPSCDEDEVVVTAPDLSIVKTVDDAEVGVGDEVEWTLTVSNSGDADAHDVVVTDALPAGLQLVSTIPADALDGSTWAVGTVEKGKSKVLKIRTKVTQPGTTENTACITGTSVVEPDTAGYCDDETVEAAKTDVSISKTADVEEVLVNGAVVWTVVVTNDSPAVAENVVVTDTLPAGLVLNEVEAPAGTSYDDATNVWTVGTLAKGASRTLTLRTTAPAVEGNVVNKVVVTTTTPEDDEENNEAQDDVDVVVADVSVTKVAGADDVVLGDEVTWTITARNDGSAKATGVVVTDTLPSGLELVSATPGQGTFDPETRVWTVGELAAGGGTATLTLVTKAIGTGEQTNTACVDTTTPDRDTEDDCADDTVAVHAPDLVVSKQADSAVSYVGGTVGWTIEVRNEGDADAHDVTVKDLLPEGLVLEDADEPSQGDFDLGTATWSVGTLAPGASATLVIRTKVESLDEKTNVVCVETSTPESDSQNNCGEDSTTGEDALPLEIEKINDPGGLVDVGDTISYTLRVSVPAEATLPHDGVLVSDYLPGHDPARPASGTTTYVAGSAACEGALASPGGTCDISLTSEPDGTVTQVVWSLGRMNPGQVLDVTFDVTVDAQSDATTETVDLVNAGTVMSAYAPLVESNEVVNTVDLVEVEGVKDPGPAQAPPAESSGPGVPGGPLAFTGIELARMLSLALLMLLVGAAVMRVARRNDAIG